VKAEGYVRVKWGSDYEYAHRIAWFIMTGEIPRSEIDHRNTIRWDNRWDNLREATSALNKENRRKARSDSRSGILGAMRNKKGFMARIQAAGVKYYLGTFPTTEQAYAAYVAAKRRLHIGGTL